MNPPTTRRNRGRRLLGGLRAFLKDLFFSEMQGPFWYKLPPVKRDDSDGRQGLTLEEELRRRRALSEPDQEPIDKYEAFFLDGVRPFLEESKKVGAKGSIKETKFMEALGELVRKLKRRRSPRKP